MFVSVNIFVYYFLFFFFMKREKNRKTKSKFLFLIFVYFCLFLFIIFILILNKKSIMSKEFITFGGGSKNYIEAGNRLLEQAKKTNIFDKTTLFTDESLKNDSIFWNQHNSFVEKNKRGYGYWLWKPYLIKKTMDQMKDGDFLMYLDAGCEINIKKKHLLNECFDIAKKDYIVGVEGCTPQRKLTKMDLILHLEMNQDNYLDSKERQGGVNLFFVCDKTRELVNTWYELCYINNYHFLDDSPSIAKNANDFMEHRHDQAIFSLLTKKYNLYSNTMLKDKGVEVIWNRTAISKL